MAIIFRFIKFFFSAKTKYDVHSPFVFDFIKNVLEDRRLFYAYHQIETVRKLLLNNQNNIQITDLGAGSKYTNSNIRSIQQIAKTALSSPSFCRTLFLIANHYKPKSILEMGTSLGISAAYLKMGALNANLITLEGCPQISRQAKKVFKRLKLKGIDLKTGDFKQTLGEALKKSENIDLIYFDGNHRKEPTLSYFKEALGYVNEDTIFIFDDIYWSDDMLQAWEKIKNHPEVTFSIDLFSMGLIFFKKDLKEKQHYKLVRWYWKPWRMGFLK